MAGGDAFYHRPNAAPATAPLWAILLMVAQLGGFSGAKATARRELNPCGWACSGWRTSPKCGAGSNRWTRPVMPAL